MIEKTETTRDPRDIYYICSGCNREAISFDKPFPKLCAECRAIKLLEDRSQITDHMPEIGAKVQLVCGQCHMPRELSVSPCPLCGNAATFQFKDE